MMKISKKLYIQSFGILTIILALIRCATGPASHTNTTDTADTLTIDTTVTDTAAQPQASPAPTTVTVNIPRDRAYHPIYSVPRFKDCFPDSQAVHLLGAEKWGVKPVTDRKDAEKRKDELVYVGANPYFAIDNLKSSVPYLVPQAAILLNDIGRQFYDSLYVKGIPFHKIIVTSVLRTKEDVSKLQRRNGNATENSCHLYGTTVDIAQNRYQTIQRPGEKRRQVQNDTLKWVLSEVLRDFRESGRCYIKYEVKQGCFHITVK